MLEQSAIHRALEETFGHSTFRPGQEQVIHSLLEGADTLAVMPTGAGKSLCYQIPALLLGGVTLVVSPLIALMEDQVAALKLAGVRAAAINSSRSRGANLRIWAQVKQGQIRLLYLSPERLMTERMIAALQQLNPTLLVVDEAHCISKWGPQFRPDYEGLSELKRHFPETPIGAFTATADETTRADIMSKLFGKSAGRLFVSGFDRPNIRLGVEFTSGKRFITEFVKRRPGVSGIVYCLSRKDTENTAHALRDEGVPALPYHAGMTTRERARNQDEFMTRPGVVMVATIAFGMGIDKPDIRYVLHTTIPGSVEAYYQELGRAGRDGQPAEALMLYGISDIKKRRHMIDEPPSNADPEDAPAINHAHRLQEHKRLDALIGYCESARCRRQVLLRYFGEESQPCGNCDLCANPPEVADGRAPALKVLAAVKATRQMFGQTYLVNVLVGSRDAKIARNRHDKLTVYGSGADTEKGEWLSLIRQMVAAGLLEIDYKYGGLYLSEQGKQFEKGDGGFQYRKTQHVRRTARPQPAGGESAALSPEESYDRALFQRLKELRLALSRERSVPAFVVFHDSTLKAMSRVKPRTPDELAQLPGVGKQKMADFSAAFLNEINNHLNE